MSQTVLNVHQFASSWASKFARPSGFGQGGDRWKAANQKRRRTDQRTSAPESTRDKVEGTQDFSVPKQSDLSAKNQRIHEILTGAGKVGS